MLTLRLEQMDALNAVMRRRFIEKTARHVRAILPDQIAKVPEAELHAVIEQGMKRAGVYQLTGEREVTLFIDLLFGLGVNFDSQPEHVRLRNLLQDPELGQREKMNLIYKKLETAEKARKPAGTPTQKNELVH